MRATEVLLAAAVAAMASVAEAAPFAAVHEDGDVASPKEAPVNVVPVEVVPLKGALAYMVPVEVTPDVVPVEVAPVVVVPIENVRPEVVYVGVAPQAPREDDFRIEGGVPHSQTEHNAGTYLEEGSLFEGDIILNPYQIKWLHVESPRFLNNAEELEGMSVRSRRNLVALPSQLWPDGIVPYDFSPEFTDLQRVGVEDALEDFMENSCVRFQKRTTQMTYILLRNSSVGCASTVGFEPVGAPIIMFLGPGCGRRGIIQHEFLHTLGFWHEHTRPDRDDHVTVNWRNIRPGLEFNFFMRPAGDVQYLQMPYDYDSVMHYRSQAFSRDDVQRTIVPKDLRAIDRIGQRSRFSRVDLAKLNRLYNCPPPYYHGEDFVGLHRAPLLPAPPPPPLPPPAPGLGASSAPTTTSPSGGHCESEQVGAATPTSEDRTPEPLMSHGSGSSATASHESGSSATASGASSAQGTVSSTTPGVIDKLSLNTVNTKEKEDAIIFPEDRRNTTFIYL